MTPQQDSLSGVIICPAYRRTAVKGELRHHNQHDSIHRDTASNQASRASVQDFQDHPLFNWQIED
jgi:hypothetical protein